MSGEARWPAEVLRAGGGVGVEVGTAGHVWQSHISKNVGPVKAFFPFFCTPLHSLLRVVLFVLFDPLHRRPRLARNLTVRPKHLSDQNFDHDYYFKLPLQGAGCPIIWTTFYFTPCEITSFPAFEPNSTNCEWSQPLRHIQYNRTASFLAMATLAILFSRRTLSADTDAASLGYTVQPPALLPPSKSAVGRCPAC